MPKSIRGVMHEFKHGELHSGSSSGKVVTNPKQAIAIAMSEQRQLHPTLAKRAEAVKAAHAHLSKTVPGFTSKPMREQMLAHQAHVRKMGVK